MPAGTGVWVPRPGRKGTGAASMRNLMFSPDLEMAELAAPELQAKAGAISPPTSVPGFRVLPAVEAALSGASPDPSAHNELRTLVSSKARGRVYAQAPQTEGCGAQPSVAERSFASID